MAKNKNKDKIMFLVSVIAFVIGILLYNLAPFDVWLYGSHILVLLSIIGAILMCLGIFEMLWILAMHW